MGISQNSDFVADISKEHRGQPTVVSDALREMLFSDSLELWRLGSRRFIRRSVEILPCKRSERFVLTFFQKPLDNLFGLCYNTSCSVERSTDGNAALAQLDRVPGYEPVGRGFESLMPRHGALADASAFLLCFSKGGPPILSGGPPRIYNFRLRLNALIRNKRGLPQAVASR